ncbi:MAG: hypothetical protein RJA61_172 [Candidatus Parcubacteria bacterium]
MPVCTPVPIPCKCSRFEVPFGDVPVGRAFFKQDSRGEERIAIKDTDRTGHFMLPSPEGDGVFTLDLQNVVTIYIPS